MYDWNVTMVNGKEYIIRNNIKDTNDMINKLRDPNYQNTVSTWDLSPEDSNRCKTIALFSNNICSIEYNFKTTK